MEMFIHMHHILSIIYIVPFLSFSTCLRDTLCILSSSDGRVFEMVRRGRGRREEAERREERGGRREEEGGVGCVHIDYAADQSDGSRGKLDHMNK